MPRLDSLRTAAAPGLLVLTALLLAACGPKPAAPMAPTAVFVTPARNDAGAAERLLPAVVRPRTEAELAFRVGGKVLSRVELGQAVRTGQVLAQLDPADVRLGVDAAVEQLRAAEVDATQAASDAARFERLKADGSVGAADAERQRARADAAAARWAQAKSQAELARNRAQHATLTAPHDGVVTSLRLEPGQVVAEGQAVMALARPESLELQVDVPEALVPGLRHWRASATSTGGEGEVRLTLRELAPSASAPGRTYRARFAPAQAGLAGWPMGSTAELRLRRPDAAASAELPIAALLTTGTSGEAGPAVWQVNRAQGTLQRTPVRVLSQTTERVRVLGLPDGAWVVSAGAQKLDAGLRVRPVARPLASAAPAGSAP